MRGSRLILLAAGVLVAGVGALGCDPQGPAEPEGPGEPAAMCGAPVELPLTDAAFRSNTPDAMLVARHTEAAEGLVLVSSNFVQDDDNPETSRWWHAEIRNDSQTTRCFPSADIVMFDDEDRVMATMELYFDAPAYEGRGDFSIPCLAPGASGFGSTLDTAPWVSPVSALARIEVSFDASTTDDAVPHPLAPMVTAVEAIVEDDGDAAVVGTVCNPRADVHFFWIHAYGLTDDGLVDYEYDTFHEGTLARGEVWDFAISSWGDGQPVADVASFVDFTLGPAEDDGAGDGGEAPSTAGASSEAGADGGAALRGRRAAYERHHRRLAGARPQR